MKIFCAIILIGASFVFSLWLCLWVMLYGGIMHAIENWGINNSAVAWGIIRAIFSGIGAIPGYIVCALVMVLLENDKSPSGL